MAIGSSGYGQQQPYLTPGSPARQSRGARRHRQSSASSSRPQTAPAPMVSPVKRRPGSRQLDSSGSSRGRWSPSPSSRGASRGASSRGASRGGGGVGGEAARMQRRKKLGSPKSVEMKIAELEAYLARSPIATAVGAGAGPAAGRGAGRGGAGSGGERGGAAGAAGAAAEGFDPPAPGSFNHSSFHQEEQSYGFGHGDGFDSRPSSRPSSRPRTALSAADAAADAAAYSAAGSSRRSSDGLLLWQQEGGYFGQGALGSNGSSGTAMTMVATASAMGAMGAMGGLGMMGGTGEASAALGRGRRVGDPALPVGPGGDSFPVHFTTFATYIVKKKTGRADEEGNSGGNNSGGNGSGGNGSSQHGANAACDFSSLSETGSELVISPSTNNRAGEAPHLHSDEGAPLWEQPTHVDLRSFHVDTAVIGAIVQGNPNLTSVDVSGVGTIDDACVEALARNIPNLRRIAFAGCARVTDTALCGSILRPPTPAPLSPRASLASLASLGMTTTTTTHALHATNSSPLLYLTDIDVARCDQLTDASVAAVARHCKYLRRIGEIPLSGTTLSSMFLSIALLVVCLS